MLKSSVISFGTPWASAFCFFQPSTRKEDLMPSYPIGFTVIVRGSKLVRVPLNRIIREKVSVLLPTRINMLKVGFNKFSDIIDDPYWRGEPITLECKNLRYGIIDGRHRIHLAIENGYKSVWAVVQWAFFRLLGMVQKTIWMRNLNSTKSTSDSFPIF